MIGTRHLEGRTHSPILPDVVRLVRRTGEVVFSAIAHATKTKSEAQPAPQTPSNRSLSGVFHPDASGTPMYFINAKRGTMENFRDSMREVNSKAF